MECRQGCHGRVKRPLGFVCVSPAGKQGTHQGRSALHFAQEGEDLQETAVRLWAVFLLRQKPMQHAEDEEQAPVADARPVVKIGEHQHAARVSSWWACCVSHDGVQKAA